jgi:3-dehydroquinate synthase
VKKIHLLADKTSHVTEDLLVLDLLIASHKGTYGVNFKDLTVSDIRALGTHFIVDRNVIESGSLPNCVYIEATEENKSYENIGPVIESLLGMNLKRDSVLVAVGGGITQDIACFIATTFVRGIAWKFVPTTLLAQADSCIGSKSSINFGKTKNLLGSFTPPNEVIISSHWLNTLEEKDINSGIGEIIKLYIIDGQDVSHDVIRSDLDAAVFNSLLIKKRFIEKDEFDQGVRQILNYGHCFGHAIESVTDFAIPHGIAVSMGMAVANQVAVLEGLIGHDEHEELLHDNFKEFASVPINGAGVLSALTKDKKNTSSKINIILPTGPDIVKQGFAPCDEFWEICKEALTNVPLNVSL